MGHNALTRAIRHAEARDLVGRNVATLVDTPKGQVGRPGKSLTLEQASALLAVTEGTRMHAYISLCLATGIRTEEARELRWDHVDFGDPDARPPVPASAAVWRSVRADGETKTEKSRRTLGLPQMAVDALRGHREPQEVVYRRELRPVLTTGAEAMDRRFRLQLPARLVRVNAAGSPLAKPDRPPKGVLAPNRKAAREACTVTCWQCPVASQT